MQLETLPRDLSDRIKSDKSLVFGHWNGWLFPCPKGCLHIATFSAHVKPNYHDPCPYCGASVYENMRVGRPVFEIVPFLWFFRKKKYLGHQFIKKDELTCS